MKYVARWITNHGQGHEQSQDIEADTPEKAQQKGEKLARKKHAQLIEVVEDQSDEE